MSQQFLDNRPKHSLSFLLCTCLAVCWQAASTANPSATKPEAALDVHATIPAAKNLVDQLYALATEIEELRAKADEVKETAPERVPIRELMSGFGKLEKAMLDVQHLKQMGEPAGHDLDRRLGRLRISIKAHAQIYGRTPAGQKLVIKHDTAARRLLPKFVKIAERAMQQASTGKVDGIDQMLSSPVTQLAENMAPLPTPYDKPYQVGFIQPLAAIMSKVEEVRSAQYRQQSIQSMEAMIQSAQEFPGKAEAAIDQFRQNASDPKAAQSAASLILKEWALASTFLVRANAVAHAFGFDQSGASSGPLATINAASSQLQDASQNAHVTLIATAAEATDPSRIAVVYGALLSSLTHAQRRSSDGEALIEACKPALAQLNAKSPALQMQLARYERATRQPLSWRARFAEQSARTMSKNSTETPGELPEHLSDWANHIAAQVGPTAIGKSVSGKPALRLLMPQTFVAVPFRSSHYLNVHVKPETTEAVKDLKSAVLVSEEFPPLSLESAQAVSSADALDFVATGGKVLGITLEPRLVRFAALPAAGYVLMPFGDMPVYRTDRYSPHDGICWRVDVEASWVQNKYFAVAAPN